MDQRQTRGKQLRMFVPCAAFVSCFTLVVPFSTGLHCLWNKACINELIENLLRSTSMLKRSTWLKTCIWPKTRYFASKLLKLAHKALSSENAWYKTSNEVYYHLNVINNLEKLAANTWQIWNFIFWYMKPTKKFKKLGTQLCNMII